MQVLKLTVHLLVLHALNCSNLNNSDIISSPLSIDIVQKYNTEGNGPVNGPKLINIVKMGWGNVLWTTLPVSFW